MIQAIYTILRNRPVAAGTYEMVLSGATEAVTRPGQFVNLRLDGFFLRRPISICDYSAGSITLIYKVAGDGTDAMTRMGAGAGLDVLAGLGNGFDTDRAGDTPLLIGGGVGCAPLFGLCRRLLAEGRTPTVILGFNTKSEIFYEKEFAALGARVLVTTADGSAGTRGLVTDAMGGLSCSHFFACGPTPMLRAVEKAAVCDGQYSLEERMGCGFGACMGCTCETTGGAKRVCTDGPVFRREELQW